ncbi:hypothetical protein ACEWY4_026128 [Coilia grayii]|uniref:Monocyte differentiation antigen CD14 n=1 Tax=Coilia grayii TaxID=363190 RepID=A0ABD1ITZ2_9TELE
MKAWHTLLLPLLLWVGSEVGVAMTACTTAKFDDTIRCKCTADTLQDPLTMWVCINTHELEFHDGFLYLQDEYLSKMVEVTGQLKLTMERLSFTRVHICGVLLSALLNILPETKIRRLDFTEAKLLQMTQPPSPTQPFPVTTISMEHVTFHPCLLQSLVPPLNIWLLSSLSHLTLRNVTRGLLVGSSDCVSTVMLVNMTELDLSQNSLTDDSVVNVSRCLSSLTQPVGPLVLSALRLSQNQLHMLQELCPLLQTSPNLVELDLSQNDLNYSAVGSSCFGSTGQLKRLNLSRTGILAAEEVVPVGVEVLDLSGNRLQEFRNPPEELKELYLSDNQLSMLPDLVRATRLEVLTLDRNQLTSLSGEASLMMVLERLSVLRAGGNPYTCGCENTKAVFLLRMYHNKVQDWPEAFLCTDPRNNSAPHWLDDLEDFNCDETSSGMGMSADVLLSVLAVVAVTVMLG